MSQNNRISAAAVLGNPAWRLALSLTERLSVLRRIGRTQLPMDGELAAELLALWRSNSPFDNDSYFADRLAVDGMTEDEFVRILGTPVEALPPNGMTAPWVQMLSRVYSVPLEQSDRQAESRGEAATLPAAGFLNLVQPLMQDARRQLQARVAQILQRYPAAPFQTGSATDALFGNLPERLLRMVAKSMVLELNAARLQGMLTGDTPQERFASFAQRLAPPDAAITLLSEYPVLARRLAICVENWITFSTEFLEHLAADWPDMQRTFNIGSDCGQLATAEAGAGDTHRHGRSVVIARFKSGFQVVYKPRSIAADEHFQAFIRWTNEKGADPPLRTLKTLKRQAHGWIEFVEAAPCRSHEEVVRFYQRQGEYLAILYVLQATDFHFENLLASGEHPVLVDLEALFHPWLRELDVTLPDVRLVALAKVRSVLRTALLPRRTGAEGDSIGIELSGLGGAPGQVAESVLQWVGEGTDQMAAVRQALHTPGAQNRPSIDGAEIDPRDFTDAIIAGFSKMYDLLLCHRDELLSASGPLDWFCNDEIRIVPRATRGYGVLLSQSLHPDYLRDALDLERLLDRLWTGVEKNRHLLPLIPAERRDLMEGDIPIFTTQPGSHHVFASNGEKIENSLPKTGMALSRENIEGLGAADRRRQIWFIRASMATLELVDNDLTGSRYEPVWPSILLSRKQLSPQLIEEARRIGERLEELALQDQEHATWIGFAYVKKTWSLDALLQDLYAGSSGIIFALAYLGSFGFTRYTELARRALNTLRIRLESTGHQVRSIGAFDGWGGIIYMLSHLASLWQDAELVSWAHRLVERLPELIEQDISLDVVGGCAGCIGALLALHSISRSDAALAAAVQCGNRLIATAQPAEGGVGWYIKNIETVRPITGFAHGAAGIAWAVLELAARTGDARYREVALRAIAYEHGQYSAASGNWAENAPGSEQAAARETGPSMAWCYGAPGIGLARLTAMKHTGDPRVREDLDRAIQATLIRGPGSNHSLCHGDLGNLDFLLQAADATRSQELDQKVDELTNQILASIHKYGWLCGVPLSVHSPALMNGLAGICYGLLRLAAPDRVPSVLTLSSPVVPASDRP